MKIIHTVEIEITDMKDGQITGFILDGKKYPKPKKEHLINDYVQPKYMPPKKCKKPKKRMGNVVDTWIRENNIVKFTLKQFFEANPSQLLQKTRIKNYIYRMVADNTLKQLDANTLLVTVKIKGSKK